MVLLLLWAVFLDAKMQDKRFLGRFVGSPLVRACSAEES